MNTTYNEEAAKERESKKTMTEGRCIIERMKKKKEKNERKK